MHLENDTYFLTEADDVWPFCLYGFQQPHTQLNDVIATLKRDLPKSKFNSHYLTRALH